MALIHALRVPTTLDAQLFGARSQSVAVCCAVCRNADGSRPALDDATGRAVCVACSRDFGPPAELRLATTESGHVVPPLPRRNRKLTSAEVRQ